MCGYKPLDYVLMDRVAHLIFFIKGISHPEKRQELKIHRRGEIQQQLNVMYFNVVPFNAVFIYSL